MWKAEGASPPPDSDADGPMRIAPQTTFILFESASGFSLFEVKEFDEISQAADKVQEAVR